MGNVVDLEQFRRRKRNAEVADTLAWCMYCGAEYPWDLRFDHDCLEPSREESRRKHPSTTV